jgi:hypothetical protein
MYYLPLDLPESIKAYESNISVYTIFGNFFLVFWGLQGTIFIKGPVDEPKNKSMPILIY